MTQCLNSQLPVSACKKLLQVAVALAGIFASVAYAQQDVPGGGRISLGETDFYPSIRLEFGTNDNAYLESNDEVETTSFAVQPGFIWLASKGSTILKAEYLGDYTLHEESALDYQNHDLNLDAKTVLGRRWRVAAQASLARDSYELGGIRTVGIGRDLDEPFSFNDLNFATFVTYGAEGARGNIEFGLRARHLEAQNHAELSQGFDYQSVSPFALFSLRVSSDTRLTFETRLSSLNYEFDPSDRDDATYLIGMRFVATGRLSGFVNLGATTSSFDAPEIDDRTDAVASAVIRYEATESAIFRFTARRGIDDASAIDEVSEEGRISNFFRLQWNQQFSGRLAHVAYIESESIELNCPDRGSSRVGLGYQLGVSVRRWIEIGGYVRTFSREFDTCDTQSESDIDYSSQRLGVFMRVTL